MCRDEEFKQGGNGEEVEVKDSISSKESLKGDGLVDGSSGKGKATCADEKAEEKAKNGSSKKEEKDDGPR